MDGLQGANLCKAASGSKCSKCKRLVHRYPHPQRLQCTLAPKGTVMVTLPAGQTYSQVATPLTKEVPSPTPNHGSWAMGIGRGILVEDPLPKTDKEAMSSSDGSLAPDAGGKPETPVLATLTKQVSRHGQKWAEDWAQMLELCKQIKYTNDQPKSLHFTVEMLLVDQSTTVACPLVMSTPFSLSTALPAMSTVTTSESTAKPSEPLTMNPAMIPNQQFPYMHVSIQLNCHWNLSPLGHYSHLGSSVTPFHGIHLLGRELHWLVHFHQYLTSLFRTPQHLTGIQLGSHP